MKPVRMSAVAALAAASSAQAYEFRARFVEQIGSSLSAFVTLPGNTIDASSGAPRRIRVQFGVFDDVEGPAPAGGFIGWNVGTLAVSGPANNSDERRTPGRLGPFRFAAQESANGTPVQPDGDPFTMLTEIDNTQGMQAVTWPLGQPEPSSPLIRGLNTYISTYEFTIDPVDHGAQNYTIALSGNVIAATEWLLDDDAIPPEESPIPEPSEPTPAWVPNPTPPRAITAVLNVVVPAPAGSTILAGVAALLSNRRRRLN